MERYILTCLEPVEVSGGGMGGWSEIEQRKLDKEFFAVDDKAALQRVEELTTEDLREENFSKLNVPLKQAQRKPLRLIHVINEW